MTSACSMPVEACTRDMTKDEIKENYEYNTGAVIVGCFNSKGLNPDYMPAVLVKNQGPFAWGKDALDAVQNAAILEKIATMAFNTQLLMGSRNPMPQILLEKHFFRKHGPDAYYGQR